MGLFSFIRTWFSFPVEVIFLCHPDRESQKHAFHSIIFKNRPDQEINEKQKQKQKPNPKTKQAKPARPSINRQA